MSGFGEDQAAHDEWDKRQADALAAQEEYEIFDLAYDAAVFKRTAELVDGGMQKWRAEGTIKVETITEGTEMHKAFMARREANRRMKNLTHLFAVAQNRAWKR